MTIQELNPMAIYASGIVTHAIATRAVQKYDEGDLLLHEAVQRECEEFTAMLREQVEAIAMLTMKDREL